ncbi:unnamed protein product [Triticum aestivum]|uniref:Uncharacterized protein n=1 Tax=Triticum aestivum TaxID=4565 RepID=A0A7H4LFL4_WHEAT|nr:unnamed protein product [Triticum aestivum]
MASSSSAVATPALIPIADRLHRSNFLVWRAHAMVAIRGTQIVFYLDPKREQLARKLTDKDDKPIDMPNPAYDIDRARDSQVLSFIFNSISAPVIIQVAHYNTTTEAWVAIMEILISQTQAHIANTRIALSMTKKGNSTVAEYISRMKALVDEMASTGKPLTDDDMVSYILAGPDFDYMSFVSTIYARTESIKVSELYSQLINFESRLAMFEGGNQSSHSPANAVSRGGHGGSNRGGGHGGNSGRYGGGRGNGGGGRGQGRGGGHDNGGGGRNDLPDVFYQICTKPNHTAMECYRRFDITFNKEKSAATDNTNPQSSYGVDTNWYVIQEQQTTSPESLTSSSSGTSTTDMIK